MNKEECDWSLFLFYMTDQLAWWKRCVVAWYNDWTVPRVWGGVDDGRGPPLYAVHKVNPSLCCTQGNRSWTLFDLAQHSAVLDKFSSKLIPGVLYIQI